MDRRTVHLLGLNALLAVTYAATARLGLGIEAVSGFATLVWPGSGIALFALLIGGVRLWPGVAIGALVANLWQGAPVPVASGIAAGNTLEAVVATFALGRLGFRRDLSRIRDVVLLIGIAALASTVISATIGVASLWAGGIVSTGALGPTWRAWWLGDAIGDLVVAPALLCWLAAPRPGRDPRRIAEALGLAALTTVLALLVFEDVFPGGAEEIRHPYVMFAVVVWAGLRFDQRGAVTVTLLACAIAIVGTTRGHGAYGDETLDANLLHAQAFTSVIAVTGLALAAVSAERRAAIRFRDDFLSIASHELRTPLTALVLQLGELQRAVRERPDDERMPRRVDRAVAVTDRMARLVEGLLDVSRVSTGQLVLRREPCELGAIAKEVVDAAGEHARRAGSSITVTIESEAPGHWDRIRVEQVLANLVSNAVKYGDGKPIEVTVGAAGGVARATVRDHGIGIAAADLDRIFGRFERAVPVRHFGGLGLGLYISQRIVEAHGGRILATSEPGAGSTFTVELDQDLGKPSNR